MTDDEKVIGQYRGVDCVVRIKHPTVKWVAAQLTCDNPLEWIMMRGKNGYLTLRTPQLVTVRIHFAFERDTPDSDRMIIVAWMPEEDRKIASAHLARCS